MGFATLYAVHLPQAEEAHAEGDWDGLPFDLGALERGIESRPKGLLAVEVLVGAWPGGGEMAVRVRVRVRVRAWVWVAGSHDLVRELMGA